MVARYQSIQNPASAICDEEWQVRVDLACLYRAAAYYGWTDSIYTHLSARVPGPEDHFLLNPFGLMFEEVTASSLVKIDMHGKPVEETSFGINEAGFTIHSAVHMARPDVKFVAHTHTANGMAVSAQRSGLLPITQNAMMFYGDNIAYHDYEGIAFDTAERERLERDLGQKFVMILRNHGLLVCGRSAGEAFEILHNLERACAAQIAALSGGSELIMPTHEVCAHTAKQFWGVETSEPRFGKEAWPAVRRLIDRHNPGYEK